MGGAETEWPSRPETCGTVSNDKRIQEGAEILFSSGQGWFNQKKAPSGEPTVELVQLFSVSDLESSTGCILPSEVCYPWQHYADSYGDITFTLKAHTSLYTDEYGFEPRPFIVKINGDPCAYLHNLAFPEFVGINSMAMLAASVIEFDAGRLYGPNSSCGSFMFCDIVNADGTATCVPLNAVGIDGGLIATMTGDICEALYSMGCGNLEEGHVGYFDR